MRVPWLLTRSKIFDQPRQRNAALDELVNKKIAEPSEIDFTAKDGVRHTAWVIRDAKSRQSIQAEFACIPCLYIADGHHRSAAAARVFQSHKGARHSGQFLSVIFPHNQMQILSGGEWVADAATAFYQEMNNDVLPGISRLVNALALAAATTNDVKTTMRNGEEEACACIPGR